MYKTDRPILIVIGNYKNGGIAKRASVLANGLSLLGNEVKIIITKEISKEIFFELNENVSLVYVNKIEKESLKYSLYRFKSKCEIRIKKYMSNRFRSSSNKVRLLRYKIKKKRNHIKLSWIISTYKYPIIISFGLLYAVDIFCIRNNKSSIILATKTYAEGELLSVDIDEDIAKAVLCGINCVVCQTHYTMDYFNKMGVTNLEVIYNPLIMDVLPYSGKKSKRIVNFCRISPEKNLEMLFEAFSKLYKLFPDYRIDIYGNVINDQEEKYKKELLKIIVDLNLSDAITIHPAVKNIHETIQDAAMFISTSNFEGLSNSMIEAMALGIPCICTDCDGGGTREMIQNGINGLLVPKGDVESLYEAMLKFAENEQFAVECGRRAIEVRNKTSVDHVIEQWSSVIEKYC